MAGYAEGYADGSASQLDRQSALIRDLVAALQAARATLWNEDYGDQHPLMKAIDAVIERAKQSTDGS